MSTTILSYSLPLFVTVEALEQLSSPLKSSISSSRAFLLFAATFFFFFRASGSSTNKRFVGLFFLYAEKQSLPFEALPIFIILIC